MITPREVFCCNAGDSRTVMSKASKAVELSRDHKPDCYDERRRIYAANSFVDNERVGGTLALSRALGDFDFKAN